MVMVAARGGARLVALMAMMRWAVVVGLAGCWRTSPAPTATAEESAHRAGARRDAPEPDPTTPAATSPATPAATSPATPGTPPAPSQCPSGHGIAARVIALSVVGSATVVTVAAGRARGVDATWSATLVVPPVACPILRIDPQATRLECSVAPVTPDQIRSSPYVLLCAP